MPSGNQEPRRDPELKRKAWLAVFLGSALFWVVVALLVVLARKARGAGSRPASIAVHSMFGTQILLGIATVMTGVALWVAVLHQLVGALLVAATAWACHVVGSRT